MLQQLLPVKGEQTYSSAGNENSGIQITERDAVCVVRPRSKAPRLPEVLQFLRVWHTAQS